MSTSISPIPKPSSSIKQEQTYSEITELSEDISAMMPFIELM